MKTRSGRSLLQGAVGLLVTASLAAAAQAAEPVKIGFGMALTGPLSANGKSALLAMQIWEEDLNAKGGLLGRPVKLIYYDDQSSPAQVPAIYAKLLDVDKVDFIVSGYASGQIAPLMPVAIQRRKIVISLFGTGINDNFKYDRYFSMIPNGPSPRPALPAAFSRWRWSSSQSPRQLLSPLPTPNSAATPARARAITLRRLASRLSMTNPIRPRQPIFAGHPSGAVDQT